MASAVVVVTRNATLSVGLIHHGYDVAEVRPDSHGEWVAESRTADAIVLELSDAVAAEAAVQRLRAEGLGIPVLLVSNRTPGWETTAEHVGAAARVLPLPISLPMLTAAIDDLIAAGPVEVPPPPRNETEMLSAVAASVGLAISDDGTIVADEGPATLPRVRPPEDLARAAAPETVAEPEPEEPAAPPAFVAPPEPVPTNIEDLVAALVHRVGELSGLDECAGVAVDELADRTGAEATVCLLPDGDEWRVAGGRGLRPPENRLRLPADHWLVLHVATDGEALVVDEPEITLAGAPLASWAHVLAVPVPGLRGVLVAARAQEPFTEDALGAASGVAAEAAALLADAVAVRELARALAPYADTDD